MISIAEAARRLDVSHTSINRRLKKMGIDKIKEGHSAYISEDDFER